MPRRGRGSEYLWAVVAYAALLWDCVSWITQHRLLSLPTDLSEDARIVVERAREAVGSAWDGFVRRCSTSVELVLEGRYAKMSKAGGPLQSDGGAAAGAPELHTVEWICGRMLWVSAWRKMRCAICCSYVVPTMVQIFG